MMCIAGDLSRGQSVIRYVFREFIQEQEQQAHFQAFLSMVDPQQLEEVMKKKANG